MLKTYLSLTKPGIITGNIIAATGGFFLASKNNPDFALFLVTMLGISLVIASGCVYNNVYDRDIDGRMSRTASRALVLGTVNVKVALAFATVLGLAGFLLIWFFTNVSTFLLAVLGFFAYVVLYTMIYKRKNLHGTIVGSISGATPPMMGYTSVVGQVDSAALLIFAAFSAWQMPHTYAIAIFRDADYKSSNIPLLPIVKGLKATQWYNAFYIVLFMLAIAGLFYLDHVSWLTCLVMWMLSGYWLYRNIADFNPDEANFDAVKWGKKLFLLSILIITLFSVMLSVDYFIPRW